MGFLTGKKLLITGVLSNRSIAYGIAKACHAQGAELAFSYVGERFKDRITEFAADFDSKLIFDCDVGRRRADRQAVCRPGVHWPKFDGFVHSIGFAPREAIAGNFLDGLTARASASPTTSAPTASRPWPRPPCPT
jgi:enoyl-[acyl-carrier protein] reductase I